jgi:hypothetical protein
LSFPDHPASEGSSCNFFLDIHLFNTYNLHV